MPGLTSGRVGGRGIGGWLWRKRHRPGGRWRLGPGHDTGGGVTGFAAGFGGVTGASTGRRRSLPPASSGPSAPGLAPRRVAGPPARPDVDAGAGSAARAPPPLPLPAGPPPTSPRAPAEAAQAGARRAAAAGTAGARPASRSRACGAVSQRRAIRARASASASALAGSSWRVTCCNRAASSRRERFSRSTKASNSFVDIGRVLQRNVRENDLSQKDALRGKTCDFPGLILPRR